MTDTMSDSGLRYLGPGLRNPAVERFDIPNPYGVKIEVFCWPSNDDPCHDDGAKVYPTEDGGWERVTGPGQTEVLPSDFEPVDIWSVTLDDRLGFDFDSRAELENCIPLLLDTMALAAKWPSHNAATRHSADRAVALRRAAKLLAENESGLVEILNAEADRISLEDFEATLGPPETDKAE